MIVEEDQYMIEPTNTRRMHNIDEHITIATFLLSPLLLDLCFFSVGEDNIVGRGVCHFVLPLFLFRIIISLSFAINTPPLNLRSHSLQCNI